MGVSSTQRLFSEYLASAQHGNSKQPAHADAFYFITHYAQETRIDDGPSLIRFGVNAHRQLQKLNYTVCQLYALETPRTETQVQSMQASIFENDHSLVAGCSQIYDVSEDDLEDAVSDVTRRVCVE